MYVFACKIRHYISFRQDEIFSVNFHTYPSFHLFSFSLYFVFFQKAVTLKCVSHLSFSDILRFLAMYSAFTLPGQQVAKPRFVQTFLYSYYPSGTIIEQLAFDICVLGVQNPKRDTSFWIFLVSLQSILSFIFHFFNILSKYSSTSVT